MKFKINDFFKVNENSMHGFIHALDPSSNEYFVEWESFPGTIHSYLASDVEPIWSNTNNKFNPKAVYRPTSEVLRKPSPQTCMHKFKPYIGFTESYEYCIHCDIKRFSKS